MEVRTNLANRTTARIVVCFHEGVIYALHGFIKKTQKTPPSDLAVAKDRKKDLENG